MSYTIVPSKRFIKAVQKHGKSGRKHILQASTEVIDLFAVYDDRSQYVLGTRWKDHGLRGDKQGIRELHLSQDDLLLYVVDEKLKIVKLLNIVNHEELRKM